MTGTNEVLIGQIETANEIGRWIPVSEYLPPPGQEVLLSLKDEGAYSVGFDDGYGNFYPANILVVTDSNYMTTFRSEVQSWKYVPTI